MISQKIKQSAQTHIRNVIINACIMSFYFGYMLVYFNSINYDQIMIIFDIHLQRSFGLGLLTGCIPISACIGAFVSSYFLNNFTRKQCFVITSVIIFFATLLVLAQNLILLIIGRIFQGLCVGIVSSITPLYIKQFVPTELTGKYGIYNQFSITIGSVFSFVFNLFLSFFLTSENYWRIQFGFPILLSVIHLYNLQYKYNYQTPRYLLTVNKDQQAKKLLKMIYKQEYVDFQYKILLAAVNSHMVIPQVENQMKKQFQMNQLNQKKLDNQLTDIKTPFIQSQNTKKIILQQKLSAKLPIFVAFHLAFLQQIIGIGTVVSYSGQIIIMMYPTLEKIFPIVIHSLGVAASFLAVTYIKIYGRVKILQYGGLIIAVTQIIIGVNFLQQNYGSKYLIIICMIIMRMTFSFSLGPVIWLYIAQIVKPKIIPFSTMMNWIGCTLVLFLFPIFNRLLSGPGYIFIFYGVYSCVALILNWVCLVQTKGKSQIQIFKEFQQREQNILKKLK